jgi:chemotaxis methyl-accepting protein methylase
VTDPLVAIAALVRAESGMQAVQPHALARALSHAAPGLDPEMFLVRARTDDELVARLLDEITVQETFFWRDRVQLSTIDWRALAQRARARGSASVDVWTAGCAGGDEAYTLALLAIEAPRTSDPALRILGTDLSRTALARATAGVYRDRSLRFVPPRLRRSDFERLPGGTSRIRERARAVVRFARHNLVHDQAPGVFDLVLCRNVLIYFDGETAARVHSRLRDAVAEGGTLMLGAADRLCVSEVKLPRIASRPSRTAKPDEAEPLFADGLDQLVRGNTGGAIAALRRTLYLEPSHAAAAFELGRAHEAVGDVGAARRAYAWALRALADAHAHERLPEQVSAGDIAAACTSRIEVLS